MGIKMEIGGDGRMKGVTLEMGGRERSSTIDTREDEMDGTVGERRMKEMAL